MPGLPLPQGVRERLCEAVQKVGGCNAAGQRIGCSGEAVRIVLNEGARLSFALGAALAKATGVSLDWIATGEGRGPSGEIVEAPPEPEPEDTLTWPEACAMYDRMMCHVADIYGDDAPEPAEIMRRAAWMMLKALGDA